MGDIQFIVAAFLVGGVTTAVILYAVYGGNNNDDKERLALHFSCKAMQCSSSMVCNRCNYVWDMNDECPPKCKKWWELNFDDD